jgi:hypothetical protein
MGSSKSKEKKKEAAKPPSMTSTAWSDSNSNRGSRVLKPNLQNFKSSSAPTEKEKPRHTVPAKNYDKNASYDAGRNGNNGDRNWASKTNTSYNLLDGTISSNDFKTVEISNDNNNKRDRRYSGGNAGDKFSNFRGLTDYRKENKETKRSPEKHRSPAKKSPEKKNSTHRRHSDVSTLELESSPVPFRKVDEKPKFSDSYDGRNRYNKRDSSPSKRRAVSSSPPRRDRSAPKRDRSPPRRNRSSPLQRRDRSPQKRERTPPRRERTPPRRRERSPPRYKKNSSRNSSNGFTNIANVKSASSMESAASAVSNYETRTKVEKFNDKRESLAIAKLAKITGIKNQFSDHRIQGPQTYDTAKQQIQSDDWEKEVKGLEIIVAISRDMPEVRFSNIISIIFGSHQSTPMRQLLLF